MLVLSYLCSPFPREGKEKKARCLSLACFSGGAVRGSSV
jgi:hypothetical protein